MVREFLNNLVHLVTPMHNNELFVWFWYFIVVACFGSFLVCKYADWNKKNKALGVLFCIITFLVFSIAVSGYDFNYEMMAKKPVIYLYPEMDSTISVRVSKPEDIICEYPEYDTGWTVVAKPNGDLKYLKTGRNLYALYYESDSTVNAKIEKDGFIVKGEDASRFLEEKLEILGLNEREAEEFIVYWLPILEENKYNYIRFETEEEINVNMPLEITPKPDSIIRVYMEYLGLDETESILTELRTFFTSRAISSTNSCGSLFCSLAFSSTFCPCSSMPVWKITS